LSAALTFGLCLSSLSIHDVHESSTLCFLPLHPAFDNQSLNRDFPIHLLRLIYLVYFTSRHRRHPHIPHPHWPRASTTRSRTQSSCAFVRPRTITTNPTDFTTTNASSRTGLFFLRGSPPTTFLFSSLPSYSTHTHTCTFLPLRFTFTLYSYPSPTLPLPLPLTRPSLALALASRPRVSLHTYTMMIDTYIFRRWRWRWRWTYPPTSFLPTSSLPTSYYRIAGPFLTFPCSRFSFSFPFLSWFARG